MCNSIYLLPLFLALSLCNSCIGMDGSSTDWWVQLIFPGKFSNNFAYMDSKHKTPSFTLYPFKADSPQTPLSQTLSQINSMSLEYVAWND